MSTEARDGFGHSLTLVIYSSLTVFAVVELMPAASTWSLASRYVVPGGLLSGFFGGLSGHQGALRSIFLLRAGLTKDAFIATGIAVALLGRKHPIGIAIGALVWGFLDAAGRFLDLDGIPREIVTILQGVIVLAVVITYQVAEQFAQRRIADGQHHVRQDRGPERRPARQDLSGRHRDL